MADAVYIRKKFKGKRKWIRIGRINFRGEFIQEIPEKDLKILRSDNKYPRMFELSVFKKYFE